MKAAVLVDDRILLGGGRAAGASADLSRKPRGVESSAAWLGGKGWDAFPRFLYASKADGCNWIDTDCAKEADVLTISAL